MIDIKLVRENPEILDNSMRRRGLEPVSKEILKYDEQKRDIQQKLDTVRHELKEVSKAGMSDIEKEQARELGEKIKVLEREFEILEIELMDMLDRLPNLVSHDTPDGLTEDDNVTVREHHADHQTWTRVQQPRKHEDVAGALLSKEQGARLAGSRFAVMHSQLAKLARVLGFWLIEENTRAGYEEVAVPCMMNPNIAYGMGVLPKFAEDLFETTTGHYMIPTAEAALVGMFEGQKFEEGKDSVIRMTSLTPCFRSEAGSAGKDTTGIIRLHQFHKAEIVCFAPEEKAQAEHERLVAHVEMLLKKLGLSYRVLAMCAGDLGFHAHKKFDIEVWMPGMDRWVEISSCSNCLDFQARRMKMKRPFFHALNGSALPIERTLSAILENYQVPGGIVIPDVLQTLFGADEIKIDE